MRRFGTGATRNSEDGKYDYEGFFSPLVLRRRAEYMHKHRVQADGTLRDSDNWQKGIPLEVYMKSLWRHFMDVWLLHRGYNAEQDLEESLTAMSFNVEGYLHELLKERYVSQGVASNRRTYSPPEGRDGISDQGNPETDNHGRNEEVGEAGLDRPHPGFWHD